MMTKIRSFLPKIEIIYTPLMSKQVQYAKLAVKEAMDSAKQNGTKEHLKEILDAIKFIEEENKKSEQAEYVKSYNKMSEFVAKGYDKSQRHHHKK